MVKVSVSIPDDLWAEAKGFGEKGQPSSQLVQAALRQWVDQQRRGGLLGGEVKVDKARLIDVAAALGTAYAVEYRRGYDDALKVAEFAGFDVVATFVRWRDWDAAAEAAPSERAEAADGQPFTHIALGPVPDFWDEVGVFDEHPGNDVYADGAAQAFLDLWEALRQGGWRTAEPAAEEAGEGA
jgi:hypothetical protein